MATYLIRNAKAVKRARWNGLDPERELSGSGRAQARGLVERLRGSPFGRLVSGPELRCRQTLEPLASERGLQIEVDARAREEAGPDEFLELIRSDARWPTVVCAHGAAIEGALAELRARGGELESQGAEKGSLWALEGVEGAVRGRYLGPLELEPGRRLAADPKRVALRPRGRTARIAVLDLGSTSFHLLVADVDGAGDLERVTRERVMLRLGASLARSARIPDEVVALALDTALELREVAERAGAECLMPVATAALRDAHNGPELAERLGTLLEVPVRVLSGEREARVIFAALRRRLPWQDETVLGADLGGGSLELIAGDDAGVHWETTLPLGVARLHGELVAHDPMWPSEAERIRTRVRELATPYREKIEASSPVRAIASGGTMGALVRRLEARRSDAARRPARGLRMRLADLEALALELVPSSHDERLALPGMDVLRADLLPTGALVLRELAETLTIDGYIWSDWGLREGVLLESIGLQGSGAR